MLEHNQLSGTIPRNLAEVQKLGELSLRNNTLSGVIPNEVLEMPWFVFFNSSCMDSHISPRGLGGSENVDISKNYFSHADKIPEEWK